ncbi:uncharacterized protein [Lolium perenne]|uniref:uncharacterized protein n=1 Tax=Lolium perenne TaxID=4522 RepID=UPI0021F62AA5|nr:uncharacterized protein LOC127327247 [Lolium perenne]
MSGLDGWKDLPEGLLCSILAQLGLASAEDLLSFAATCHSWNSAFSASLATFPPLLFQLDIPPCPLPQPYLGNKKVPNCQCLVTDITKPNKIAHLCHEIPPLGRQECFIGASYGHLIWSSGRKCSVMDMFAGFTLSSPQLPNGAELNYGALTAPTRSPNSCLIVDTGEQNLFWRVGSKSWASCSTRYGTVKQIVVFKGQVFGMDSDCRLFKVGLTPEISIHEVLVMQSSMTSICQLSNAWLVACGDMLLLVGWSVPTVVSGITFEVFRLDLSTEPALWLKMEKLDNWAIFISTDKRSQALSCKNPQIWGGKSNHIYCYNHESKSCIALEMDKPLQGDGSESNSNIFTYMGCDRRMQPMWLVPSMLSLCGSDGEVHDGWLMYLVFRSLYCRVEVKKKKYWRHSSKFIGVDFDF